RTEIVTSANERLLKELLPILDDLERALEAAAQHEEAQLEEGVRLVHRALGELLRKHGVAELEAAGRFDPHVHEALLTQPSAAAEEKFKEVQTAYDVLSDPEKRKQYDRFGAANGRVGGAGGPGGFNVDFGDFGDLGDLFGNLFGSGGARGGRQARPQPERGADIEARVNLSFEDSLRGLETKIPVEVDAACRECGGTGAQPGTAPVICPECNGRGVKAESQGLFALSTPCPRCRGNGTVIEQPCPNCHGSGRERRIKTYTVNVKPGVKDGTRIRLKGKGEPGLNGRAAGDRVVGT